MPPWSDTSYGPDLLFFLSSWLYMMIMTMKIEECVWGLWFSDGRRFCGSFDWKKWIWFVQFSFSLPERGLLSVASCIDLSFILLPRSLLVCCLPCFVLRGEYGLTIYVVHLDVYSPMLSTDNRRDREVLHSFFLSTRRYLRQTIKMPAFVLMKTILVPSPKPNTSKSVTGGNGYHRIWSSTHCWTPLGPTAAGRHD